jgi:hypothetical protein
MRMRAVSAALPWLPMWMLLLPVSTFCPARDPMAVLSLPVVLLLMALTPVAVLKPPVVLLPRAAAPVAVLVLLVPVVFLKGTPCRRRSNRPRPHARAWRPGPCGELRATRPVIPGGAEVVQRLMARPPPRSRSPAAGRCPCPSPSPPLTPGATLPRPPLDHDPRGGARSFGARGDRDGHAPPSGSSSGQCPGGSLGLAGRGQIPTASGSRGRRSLSASYGLGSKLARGSSA